MNRECQVVFLGKCEYQYSNQLQKEFLRQRIEGTVPDTLILVQHYPVITMGRKGNIANIVANREVLNREGITVHQVDRGGDVTYHGPGQIVAYPILDLNWHGKDVHRVLFRYEEVIIEMLSVYGLKGSRLSGYPGVWVGNEKICAIGIGIRQWVTYHGFALNVNTNLDHFGYIKPCGLSDKGVTSMHRLLNQELDDNEVMENMIGVFGRVFGLEMKIQECNHRL